MLSIVVLLGVTALSFCAFSVAEPQSRAPDLLTANVLAEDPSKLFAVVGGGYCAESLVYGPQDITTSGSVDGVYKYYLSTKAGSVPHDTWLQVVTDGGTKELYRIYWSFSSHKTVTERLVNAVKVGEKVSYRVVYTSLSGYADQYYTGTWRFSSASGITASTFTSSSSKCCLSANSGAWGAGTGTIDGSAGYVASSFWGIGNFDSYDSSSCYKVYKTGTMWWDDYPNSKSYLYFNTFYQPTFMPTSAPIGGSVVSMKVSQKIDGASSLDYSAERIGCDEVMTESVVAAIPGILPEDVRDFIVYPRYSRRNLQEQEPSLHSVELLSGRCRVEYYVTVPSSRGIKYSQMAASLQNSVNTNQFTTLMQGFATQRNVAGLQSATSNSVTVNNDSPESGGPAASKIDERTIIGIAIGGSVGVLLLIVTVTMAIRQSASMQPPSLGYYATPGASPVPYNVPPVHTSAVVGPTTVSTLESGCATVNAGVELQAVYGGFKASAPPAAGPSKSFFSFGRNDPSHTRW